MPDAVRALAAQAFAASLGVNVHVGYTDTAYGDLSKLTEALGYLQIRRVRDNLNRDHLSRWDTLAKAGVKANFYLPGKTDPRAYVERLEAFAAAHPGAVASLEGANEVNYWPTAWNGRTDLASQAALQRAYYGLVKGSRALRTIPLSNLSLGGVGAEAHRQLGDMRGACDFANAHVYFGPGAQPATIWSYAVGLGQIACPGKPAVITETGYSTAVRSDQGVDETTQAKQTLNLLMDAAKNGYAQTYLYELVDQKPDPGRGDKERNFGLFRNDWSPKPAATAIRNLLGVVTHDTGPIRDASLAYSVSGLPKSGAHQLLQEREGVFDLVIWAEPDIWDEKAKAPIAAPAAEVVVRFKAPVKSYGLYDPLAKAAPLRTGGPTSELRVQVSDHPVILRVKV